MTEVAGAWQMRLMTDADPFMVAAVLSFLQFPVFLLVIPAGVIADLADRRKLMLYGHVWVCLIMLGLTLLTSAAAMTPAWLLIGLGLVAVGQALRMPSIGTLIPDLVATGEIPAAVSLNGIAQNGSRVVGPAIAGTIVGIWGTTSVYGINALAAAAIVLLFATMRYHGAAHKPLSWENFSAAIVEGLSFAAATPWQRHILIRIGLFFFCVASIPALMAVRFDDSTTYGIMYGCFGAGAIAGLVLVGRLRGRSEAEQRIAVGIVAGALSLVLLSTSTHWSIAGPLLSLSGAAWTFCSNSYMVAAQLQLPNRVRGRGLSFVYATGMACLAAGSACWGLIARLADPGTALMLAGGCLFGGFLATRHLRIVASSPPAATRG
jgi:MFS family permease